MEPPSLVCAESLALHWHAVFRRDGLTVRPGASPYAGEVGYRGRLYPFEFTPSAPGRCSFELSQVSDRALYRRLERIVLASGARFNLATFASAGIGLLYRCRSEVLDAARDALRARGMAVTLAEGPAFGGGAGGESFLSGSVARGGHRAEVETGPAFDPERCVQAYFLELRPTFRLRIGPGLAGLLHEADAEVKALGGQVVMTLPAVTGTETETHHE